MQSPAPGDRPAPPLQGRTNKTAVLDPAPTDPSWPVPAADRVNVRESLFAEAFNRLLQQNLPLAEVAVAAYSIKSLVPRDGTACHSGSPALRRPLAKVAKSFASRNGAKSLRLEACKSGSHSSARDMALCAGSSRPASALLAAETHIASRKVGLSRIDFSAHDDAMS